MTIQEVDIIVQGNWDELEKDKFLYQCSIDLSPVDCTDATVNPDDSGPFGITVTLSGTSSMLDDAETKIESSGFNTNILGSFFTPTPAPTQAPTQTPTAAPTAAPTNRPGSVVFPNPVDVCELWGLQGYTVRVQATRTLPQGFRARAET